MLVCVDLDGTISAFPQEIGALMSGLMAQGHEVHILTGHKAESASPEVAREKIALVKSLGCENNWDKLVLVANPKNKVAKAKVAYMRHAGASVLIDNDKHNVKAASKAGFMALRPHRKTK